MLPLHLFNICQDLLAPPRCMGCLRENTWLCRRCNLSRTSPVETCIACQEPRPRGVTCGYCRDSTPLYGLISAGPYGSSLLRRGIHWLKFKNIKPTAFPLAQMLVIPLVKIAPLEALQKSAVLIPVPLHRKKQRQRGFNQALEIARHLHNLARIPVCEALERPKSTLTQTKLPLEIRERNTKNAFRLQHGLPETARYIIILDDVTTSGSTLSAAAAVIPRQKEREIWGLTVARS